MCYFGKMTKCVKYNFINYNLWFVLIITVIYKPNRATAVVDEQDVNIHSDYYWGNKGLRSKTLSCDLKVMTIMCFYKCGRHFICENDECKCKKGDKPLKIFLMATDGLHLYPFGDNTYLYSDENHKSDALRAAIAEDTKQESKEPDNIKTKNVNTSKKISKPKTLSKKHKKLEDTELQYIRAEDDIKQITKRPVLRHHIAHFCPNLKKARTCIRSCMKLGKPAFCGKDHVCYCGHRYTSHDQDKKVDVTSTYAQFRDLYEKYFGPQIFENENDYSEEENK